MLDRHRATDALKLEPEVAAKTTARIARLTKDAHQLREWLATRPEGRRGPTGALRKNNETDNEGMKMATGKGVIQGYTGVAVVDTKHQRIVEAQAHATGSKQELLLPVDEALATSSRCNCGAPMSRDYFARRRCASASCRMGGTKGARVGASTGAPKIAACN